MTSLLNIFGKKLIDLDVLRKQFHAAPINGIDYVAPLGGISVIDPDFVVPENYKNKLAFADYKPWLVDKINGHYSLVIDVIITMLEWLIKIIVFVLLTVVAVLGVLLILS